MKKIIVDGILEESTYYCDKHPEKECFSELKTSSWYGSKFDLTGIELHLCDECLEKIFVEVKRMFNTEPKDIEI